MEGLEEQNREAHKMRLVTMHGEFLEFCYFNQYKYEHFRPMDRHMEFDSDGYKYFVYSTNSDW